MADKKKIVFKHEFAPTREDGNVHLALSSLGFAVESITGGTGTDSVPDRAEAVIHCMSTRPIADAVIKYKRGFLRDMPPEAGAPGETYNIKMEPVGEYNVKIVAEGKSAPTDSPSEGVNAVQRLCWMLADLFGTLAPQPVSFIKDFYGLEYDGSRLGLQGDLNEMGVSLAKIDYTRQGGSAEVVLYSSDPEIEEALNERFASIEEVRAVESKII